MHSNRYNLINNLKKNPGGSRLRDLLGAVCGGGRCSGRHGVCPCPPPLHRSSGTAVWTQSAGEDVCLRAEEATSQSQPGKRDTLMFHQIYREMRLMFHLWFTATHKGPHPCPPSFHLADDDVICFSVIHTEMFDCWPFLLLLSGFEHKQKKVAQSWCSGCCTAWLPSLSGHRTRSFSTAATCLPVAGAIAKFKFFYTEKFHRLHFCASRSCWMRGWWEPRAQSWKRTSWRWRG